MSKKRKLSVTEESGDALDAPQTPTKSPEPALASFGRNVKRMFTSSTANGAAVSPVINGATPSPRNFLKNLISDVASQAPRINENFGLLTSLAETKVLKGGLIDDKQYQIEQILQLAASLPVNSKALNDLSGKLIGQLWENLQHPPLSYMGDNFKYRMADGSNNNIMYPQLGAAGSSYARTVVPKTLQPGVLPDPALIFDTIYAAQDAERREHPSKISSMLFYLAAIIIHDLFRTDERDQMKLKNSSYLDLSPLYGSNDKDQASVRAHKDGLLKPDAFVETRVLGFPPGVSAMLVCFNRYHNYIALQLKEINDGGRFSLPLKPKKADLLKQDNDLFQTARLVNCGLYINIVLGDYVRTILNLQRTSSSWTLDPRESFDNVFDKHGVPSGVGNQVSVEFNLIYRWHSAISRRDEKWTEDFYATLFPNVDYTNVQEIDLIKRLREWQIGIESIDPGKREFGEMARNANGTFNDADLVKILSDSTEDVACAFGPQNVPIVMRLVEVLGIKQARRWKTATLNEFRKFFSLEPHKEFADITKNENVARSLKTLYTHPDYVELYPGLVAEDAKIPLEPGSGLCPGFTISRTILADAVALTRGDRFYTVDYTPANLTNWGFSQVKPDPDVAGGGVIYNLLMRALPFYYRGNSVYAMYPFTIPSETQRILRKLKIDDRYSFDRPSYIGSPIAIKTYAATRTILGDQARYKVPWGPHTYYLTHHDYMLSGDEPANLIQHKEVYDATYCPVNGLAQIRVFYEDLTTQLIEIKSEKLGLNDNTTYQLDFVRDVANPSHAVFVAKMFHLPLTGDSDLIPTGVTVDQLYLALAVLFAYVFLDLDTARSFKLRSAAAQASEAISKLVRLVCEAVHIGKTLRLSSLFNSLGGSNSGKLLGSYGTMLIQRLFAGGKSVDDVVWTVIPTIAAAVATQAQHVSQMLDIYMRPEHAHHWADIRACAFSDEEADFEKLKSYALEANRLWPAAFGLVRRVAVAGTVVDGAKKVHLKEGDTIYTDFISAGMDPDVFPNPAEIDITRDKSLYIHQGHGPHRCIGRPIVEMSMASQLRVLAKLKGLRRAPGEQGRLKSSAPKTPNPVSSHPEAAPGKIDIFMKEDWSDWWPFPTCKSDFCWVTENMLISCSYENSPRRLL